jgi:hypothetical protein
MLAACADDRSGNSGSPAVIQCFAQTDNTQMTVGIFAMTVTLGIGFENF